MKQDADTAAAVTIVIVHAMFRFSKLSEKSKLINIPFSLPRIASGRPLKQAIKG